MNRIDRPNGASGYTQNKSTYVPYRDRYERATARAKGLNDYVDATPVRERVQALKELGFTQEGIARKAGVSTRTIRFISQGEYRGCRRRVADAILGVEPTVSRVERHIPSFGVKRRIKALQRFGYRYADIDEGMGLPAGTASNLACREYVSYPMWAKVAEGYEQLSATPGSSAKSARIAAKTGWPSPMDWEAANIDDPTSFPDMRERVIGSRSELRTKKDTALRMIESGVSRREIASQLDVSLRTIERWASGR